MRGALPLLPNTPSWRGAQLKCRENFTYQECVELYFHTPNTPSWCGAQLKHWSIFMLAPVWLIRLFYLTTLLITKDS